MYLVEKGLPETFRRIIYLGVVRYSGFLLDTALSKIG